MALSIQTRYEILDGDNIIGEVSDDGSALSMLEFLQQEHRMRARISVSDRLSSLDIRAANGDQSALEHMLLAGSELLAYVPNRAAAERWTAYINTNRDEVVGG